MKILHYISKYYTRILLFILILITAFASIQIYSKRYDSNLEKLHNAEEIKDIVCRVETATKKDENTAFTGKVIKSKSKEFKGYRFKFVIKSNKQAFLPGDTIKIKEAKLFAPSDKTNMGSFDEIEYQKGENLYGSIYSENKAEIIKTGEPGIIRHAAKLKSRFSDYLGTYLDKRTGSIALALLSGDKSGIGTEDSSNLKNSGVYHIVAISGLHLNIFIMIMSVFISGLKMKRLKKALLSFVLCMITSAAVLIFTGFGLSVIRAFIMLVISLGSSIVARKYDSKNALYLATGIIVIFIPRSFFSIGFRLSVLSTLAVLVSADFMKKLKNHGLCKKKIMEYISGTVITSVLCSVFTLPVMINSFGFLPVYSFLGNLFILPFTTPALALCALFGLLSFSGLAFPAYIISFPLAFVINLIMLFASIISSIPFGVLKLYPLYTLYAGLLIAIAICIMYCIFKKKLQNKCICICVILALATGSIFLYNRQDRDARVIFADVGQGECAIIKLPRNKAVMIDFGTSYGNEYVAKEIEATLTKLSIPKLSAVFISHFHTDHISGFVPLLKEKKAEKIYVPRYYDKSDSESRENLSIFLSAALLSPSELHMLSDGDKVSLNGALFEILSPGSDFKGKANDMSMVIKFTYGDVSFLFTGDIEDEGIKTINEKDIKCDVIKVPHHGGESNEIPTLAKNADADYAVISCGKNNAYGHPKRKTTDAFKDNGAKIYRTDRDGAISFYINEKEIKKTEKMR